MNEVQKFQEALEGALPAQKMWTSPLVAGGLIGGWLTARVTKNRPLGGAILLAAGALAARSWVARGSVGEAASLSAGYLAAFGLSHPLAKKIGAWPSVLTVSAAAAGAAYAVSDRKIGQSYF